MRTASRLCAFGFVALTGLGLLTSCASDENGMKHDKDMGDKKMSDAKAAEMTPEQMMAAMQKAGELRKEHELLKAMAGNFTVESKMWMDPSAPPEVSTGEEKSESIFGGRFVKFDYSGKFMGKDFKGFGLTGFNNLTGQYEMVWIDDTTTAISKFDGKADASGKVITFTTRMMCPMDDKPRDFKEVVTITDNDHHMMEMYDIGPDGKETKGLEIKYTRVK